MRATQPFTVTAGVRAPSHDEALPLSALGMRDEPFPHLVPDRVVVRSAGRIVAIAPESIEWIEAADNYVRLHTTDRVHMARETLAALETRLDRRQFVRIHRSAIVNIDAVKEILSSRGSWQVRLRTGERLPVGRTHRRQLRAIVEA
jgi:two-component system, LytTR family, response regulator